MKRLSWGDAFQELEDSECNYEIFTKTSTTLESISDSDWKNIGIFNYENMKQFLSNKQTTYGITYAYNSIGNDSIYVFKSDNIKEKYFQIKIKRAGPL